MVPQSCESSSLGQQLNSNSPRSAKQSQTVVPRMSERLRFKTKLKESKKKPKPSRRRSPSHDKELDVIDRAQRSIEPGNPAHKLLFITYLGLVPKADAKIPPYVHLQRLPNRLISSKNISDGSSVLLKDNEYSDIEDLDLELVFCPLDIPEIYEEITRKKCPTVSPTFSPVDEVSSISDCSSGESGYESSTNGIECKSQLPPVSALSKRIHYAYKSSAGERPSRLIQSASMSPLVEMLTHDQSLSKKRVREVSPVATRRSSRVVAVKTDKCSRNEPCIVNKSQVSKCRPNNNLILPHVSTNGMLQSGVRNVAIPRKVLVSSQHQQHCVYINHVPNSIEVFKKRLLALHTDLEFVDD